MAETQASKNNLRHTNLANMVEEHTATRSAEPSLRRVTLFTLTMVHVGLVA